MAAELESDLRDTVDRVKKWLVDLNNNGYTYVKMDVSVLGENYLLRCLGWPSLLIWIEALTLSLLLKLSPRNLEL